MISPCRSWMLLLCATAAQADTREVGLLVGFESPDREGWIRLVRPGRHPRRITDPTEQVRLKAGDEIHFKFGVEIEFVLFGADRSKDKAYRCGGPPKITFSASTDDCERKVPMALVAGMRRLPSLRPAALRRSPRPPPDDPTILIDEAVRAEAQRKFPLALEKLKQARQKLGESPWLDRKIARLGDLSPRNEAPKPEPVHYAVVAGLSSYLWLDDKDWALHGAAADADWFAQVLRSNRGGVRPQNLYLLTDSEATAGALRRRLWRVLRELAHRGDTVTIYLAGHGVEAGNSGQGFFAAWDSRVEDARTLLSFTELLELIAAASASGVHVNLYADLCHAGRIVSRARANRRLLDQIGAGNFWGILASGPDSVSFEDASDASDETHGGKRDHGHGYFTQALVRAFRAAPDKALTRSTLFTEVEKQLRALPGAMRQVPVEIRGASPDRPIAQPGIIVNAHDYRPREGQLSVMDAADAEQQWRRLRDSADREAALAFLTNVESAASRIFVSYLSGDEIPLSTAQINNGLRLTSILAAAPYPLRPEEHAARSLFFRARLLIDQGRRDKAKYQEALAILEPALRMDTELALVFNLRGLAYLGLGDAGMARLSFLDAVRIAPDWLYARHNLALAYEAESEYRLADEQYQEAILRSKNLGLPAGATLHNRGHLMQCLGEYDAALALYRDARLAFQEQSARFQQRSRRAVSDADRLLLEEYAAYFRRAEAEAWNAAATVYAEKGRFAEARQAFDAGYKLYPGSALLIFNQLRILERSGTPLSVKEQVRRWREVVETEPSSAPARLQLATLLRTSDAASVEAEQHLSWLVREQAASLDVFRGLLEIYVTRKQFDLAENVLGAASGKLTPGELSELEKILPTTQRRRTEQR